MCIHIGSIWKNTRYNIKKNTNLKIFDSMGWSYQKQKCKTIQIKETRQKYPNLLTVIVLAAKNWSRVFFFLSLFKIL